jgi:hypothetical protein
MTRFVALSLIYKKQLMARWPDGVTEEWLDVLNSLEKEIECPTDDTSQA